MKLPDQADDKYQFSLAHSTLQTLFMFRKRFSRDY